MDRGVEKSSVYSVMMVYHESTWFYQGIISDITDTPLFGLVWLQPKYSNCKPNAVTTIADSVAALSTRAESSSRTLATRLR